MVAVPKPKKKERIKNPFKNSIPKESNPLECIDQETVADWLDAHNVFYTATMAGSFLHPATFNRMKKMGLKKGVADILIFDTPPAYYTHNILRLSQSHPNALFSASELGYLYCGVCLEMKRKKGGIVSEEQRLWLEKMTKLKWLCFVANGADSAIEFLEQCGYGGRAK
jgi:hypothetical protein